MAGMTFWEHLDVFRRSLLRVAAVWVLLAAVFFAAMPWLFDAVVLAPCHHDFVFYSFLRKIGGVLGLQGSFFGQHSDVKLININLAAPFFIHISTAFWMSVVASAPYLIYELWRFVEPALYPGEKKPARRALGLGALMFYVGVLAGYFIVYPLTLRFLAAYELSAQVENQISLNSYIDSFMMLVLAMGLVFELPLLVWLLSAMGVIDRALLRKYRRHAVVAIFILAAVITPTGDPFTLAVVAAPLCLLYELGILLAKKRRPA